MTVLAPAAMAFATSPEKRIPRQHLHKAHHGHVARVHERADAFAPQGVAADAEEFDVLPHRAQIAHQPRRVLVAGDLAGRSAPAGSHGCAVTGDG